MRKIILLSAFILFLLPFISAEVNVSHSTNYSIIENDGSINITNIPIIGFGAKGFVCSNPTCSTISSSLWSSAVQSTFTNLLKLTYPASLQSADGYGVYFFKAGYIPTEILTPWAGDGEISFEGFLSKKRDCTKPIKNLIVTNNKGELNIKFAIDSPISHSGPLSYNPPELSSHYSVDMVLGSSVKNNTTISKENTINIPFSGTGNTEFDYNLTNDYYEINVKAYTNDPKCLNTGINLDLKTVYINITDSIFTNITTNGTDKNVTTDANQSRIGLTIISPTSTTYTSSPIPLNIIAENATNILYSLNGAPNITYTAPTTIIPILGTNKLDVFANNLVYNETKTVYFTYTIPPIVDTDPPAYSNITRNFPDPSAYNPNGNLTFSINLTDPSGIDTAILNINNITYPMNFNGTVYTVTVPPLGVGNYTYFVWANDTRGNNVTTPSQNFQIIKATPYCFINASSTNLVYPSNLTVNAYCTNPETGINLFRNNININSEINLPITLLPGSYLYKVNSSETQNYSYAFKTISIVVRNDSTNPDDGDDDGGEEDPEDEDKKDKTLLDESEKIFNGISNFLGFGGDDSRDKTELTSVKYNSNSLILLLMGLSCVLLLILIILILLLRATRRSKHKA